MILGPTVGGILYEAGGYTLPFAILGSILLLMALISTRTLPSFDKAESVEVDKRFGMFAALKIPSVFLATFAVFAASIAVGALQATFERHLAQFDLSPVHIGFFFMLYGGSYALLNPFWGWLADKTAPKYVLLIGSFLLALGKV